MIKYRNAPFHVRHLFQCTGSTFPFALAVAIPCTVTAIMLKWVQRHINTPWAQGLLLQVIDNNAAYTSFTFLCGFLIVFRTSQAYGRFWEGCTSIKSMEAEWLSGCSAAVSFCRLSTAEEVLILRFQHQLIRLMSMLHAAALAQLEGTEEGELPRAFMLELIDARGIDKESLETLRNEECKVELIIQWLQALMVDNIKNGVLNIPPPILSRVFHNLSNGLHHFYDAYKIADTPYPFPYMQVTEVLLILHWLVTPIVIAMWTKYIFWSGAFCFLTTFILWALNTIATQLENPFGTDSNDFDAQELQHGMNMRLLLFLRPSTNRLPMLSSDAILEEANIDSENEKSMLSFQEVWEELREDVQKGRVNPISRRITTSMAHREGISSISHGFSQEVTAQGGEVNRQIQQLHNHVLQAFHMLHNGHQSVDSVHDNRFRHDSEGTCASVTVHSHDPGVTASVPFWERSTVPNARHYPQPLHLEQQKINGVSSKLDTFSEAFEHSRGAPPGQFASERSTFTITEEDLIAEEQTQQPNGALLGPIQGTSLLGRTPSRPVQRVEQKLDTKAQGDQFQFYSSHPRIASSHAHELQSCAQAEAPKC